MARKYRCPGCGKRVKFGTHFCTGDSSYSTKAESRLDDPFPEYKNRRSYRILKRAGVVGVALGLVLVMLSGLRMPLTRFIVISILLGAAAIPLIFIREKQEDGNRTRSRGYRDLLKLLGGDEGAADRLVTSEMQAHPDFTREECIRRVHDKLEYDRSR